MFNAVAVDTLRTIKYVPILVSQLFAIESGTSVRVSHLRKNRIDSHLNFVVLLKIFLHPVIIEDAFPGPHYSVLKSEVLHCERATKQNNQTKPFRAELERLMHIFDVFASF